MIRQIRQRLCNCLGHRSFFWSVKGGGFFPSDGWRENIYYSVYIYILCVYLHIYIYIHMKNMHTSSEYHSKSSSGSWATHTLNCTFHWDWHMKHQFLLRKSLSLIISPNKLASHRVDGYLLCPEYFHKQLTKPSKFNWATKKSSNFALYGLFNGDPYNGLL